MATLEDEFDRSEEATKVEKLDVLKRVDAVEKEILELKMHVSLLRDLVRQIIEEQASR